MLLPGVVSDKPSASISLSVELEMGNLLSFLAEGPSYSVREGAKNDHYRLLQIVFLLLLLCQLKKAANQPKCFAQPRRGSSTDPQCFSGALLKPASFWSETFQVSFKKQSWSQDWSPSPVCGDSAVGKKNWLREGMHCLRDAILHVRATLVLLLSWAEVSLKILPVLQGLQGGKAGQDGGCWG